MWLLDALYDNRFTRWWAHVTRAPEGEACDAPWRIGLRGWGRIYARAADGAMRDDYGIVASSIAFAAFLSILPLLSLVAMIYAKVAPPEVVTGNIATLVHILPDRAQQLVRGWLTNSLARHDGGAAALLISALITLFGGRRAGRSLLRGINLASGIEQDRALVARQLVSLGVVLATAGLLLAALVSISVLAVLEDLVPDGLPGARQAFHLLFWGSAHAGACRRAAADLPLRRRARTGGVALGLAGRPHRGAAVARRDAAVPRLCQPDRELREHLRLAVRGRRVPALADAVRVHPALWREGECRGAAYGARRIALRKLHRPHALC